MFFGGSFDPIHQGHTILLKAVMQHTACDNALIVPAAVNPFKNNPLTQPTENIHRLNMCRLACEDIPGAEVSDIEFSLPKPSYTINTIRALMKMQPDTSFTLVCGSDALLGLEKWVEFEQLVKLVSFCTDIRPGDDAQKVDEFIVHLKNRYYADIQTVHCNPADVSSTRIRRNIREGKPITGMVHPKVEKYIFDNNLYGGNDARR